MEKQHSHALFHLLFLIAFFNTREIFDHPQSGMVYNFSRFCMSVCLSDDNFRKTSRRKFTFANLVYLQAIWVKFVYEGHQVTGPKKVQNRYTRNGCLHVRTNLLPRSVKIPLPITRHL